MNKADLASLAIACIVAFLTFNFFYTVTITPFGVNLHTPLSYCAPDDKPIKLIVQAKENNGLIAYEFWYEWPYDGWYKRVDWEPVIVYVKGDSVYAVAVRTHYNWRVDFHPPVKDGRPIITFAYRWHTPLLKSPPKGYVVVNLTPVFSKPPEDVDPSSIIGIPTPFSNAFASAILYATIAFTIAFLSTDLIFRKIF